MGQQRIIVFTRFPLNAVHSDFAFPFAGRFVMIRWDAQALGHTGAEAQERIDAR